MIITRRGFFKALAGAGTVVAASLIVPPVARKFFLPPTGGWISSTALNVGDIITLEGVHDPLTIRRCKQFVVVSVDDNGAIIDPHERIRYDAAWTLSDGKQEQYYIDYETRLPALPDTERDDLARRALESIMRRRGGRPGATQFKLELPRNIQDARYI